MPTPATTYDLQGGRAAVPGLVAPSPGTAATKLTTTSRLDSIDAYRGFVMFLMMAEVLRVSVVAKHFPDSAFWQGFKFNTSHVEWGGFSLHDLIQPGFSFLVGVSLPFSIASREAKGQSVGRMLFHAIWRAIVLTFLGVFLRSHGRPQTYFTFEDTLSQIGMGYVFLFLIGLLHIRYQILVCLLILAGYWGAFAMHPLPGPDFPYHEFGVKADWPYHYQGFAAHWNKNSNLAWDFDRWFLNLFPRAPNAAGEPAPFTHNGGGYATLSFIPTLCTMILGSVAGGWLRLDESRTRKILYLLAGSAVCLVAGYGLDYFGICPSVKRIWTPSWTLFSGGWCFLTLAGFYAFVDCLGWRPLVYPLIVIGANSIAAYCMDHWCKDFIGSSLQTNFFQTRAGQWVLTEAGPERATLVRGGAILLVEFLILLWMYRKKVFIKI